ncbi:MAG TPA: hypothetical protein VJL28_03740 [Gemmatimonadaceae bacterium]|nr:hypothetical protein [Gemmatimonadaceae bacterium]
MARWTNLVIVIALFAPAAALSAQTSRLDTSRAPARLIPENREIYRLMREMLVAADPKPGYRALMVELSCAADWYGMPRTKQLLTDAEAIALKTDADRQAYRRLGEKLHAQFFDVPDCPRPRPASAQPPTKKPQRALQLHPPAIGNAGHGSQVIQTEATGATACQ